MTQPQIVGAAEYLGTFEHDSELWHETRAATIGSSDVAAILGLSQFKSAFTLWHEKAGLIEPTKPDAKLQRKYDYGHHMEPFVARLFMQDHPELLALETGSWRHAQRIWQGCNPDRLVTFAEQPGENPQPHSLLELKTFPSLSDWFDGVPAGYRVQLLWQLDTFGFRMGWVCGYANLSGDYVEYPIELDPFEADAIRGKVQRFADSITAGVPPEIDGSEGTYQTLRRLNPSLDRGKQAEIEQAVGEQYLDALKAYKLADSDLNKWKGHMLAHMGTAQYALFDGKKIASRVAAGGNVPYLKEA